MKEFGLESGCHALRRSRSARVSGRCVLSREFSSRAILRSDTLWPDSNKAWHPDFGYSDITTPLKGGRDKKLCGVAQNQSDGGIICCWLKVSLLHP